MLRLHNTLTRAVEEIKPLKKGEISIYSCGPTVYSAAHIGNMASYVVADTLRRVIQASGYRPRQVMNYTDIDDKTIRRSQELHGADDPMDSLTRLTRAVENDFQADLRAIGVDVDAMLFVRATESIEEMLELIRELHSTGIAYVADDGVYFSIEAYRRAGKTYGQLSDITAESTGAARVDNDEYDKENIHDFALWKTQKEGEPAWPFELDDKDLRGRPGWHIECSAMARANLGQPFDIHTGGIDLIFPHHENEIAQSTGAGENETFAQMFVHSEHLLISGKKMAKSEGNVYLIKDIIEKGYEPTAFRLLVLQGHYRHQVNFSWDNLEAAQNRLKSLRALADLRFQYTKQPLDAYQRERIENGTDRLLEHLQNDLDTPQALAELAETSRYVLEHGVPEELREAFESLLGFLDTTLGLSLTSSADISDEQKALIRSRHELKSKKDYATADQIRDELLSSGIDLRDTPNGPLWQRV